MLKSLMISTGSALIIGSELFMASMVALPATSQALCQTSSTAGTGLHK